MKGYSLLVVLLATAIFAAFWVISIRTAVAPTHSSIVAYESGVRGTVLLGPTCPVIKDPPDPQCADKPYATEIIVRRAGSNSTIATGKSDNKGSFEFSLPPGVYTVSASGGKMLPRCNDIVATVGASGYISIDISCDTGIR